MRATTTMAEPLAIRKMATRTSVMAYIPVVANTGLGWELLEVLDVELPAFGLVGCGLLGCGLLVGLLVAGCWVAGCWVAGCWERALSDGSMPRQWYWRLRSCWRCRGQVGLSGICQRGW